MGNGDDPVDERAFRAPPEGDVVLELAVVERRAQPDTNPAAADAPAAPGKPLVPVPPSVLEEAAATGKVACGRHLDQSAGWWCDLCALALCRRCTVTQMLSRRSSMLLCGQCRRAMEAITVPRATMTPMTLLARRAWLWPLRRVPLVIMVLLSAISFIPILGWIGDASVWVYLFALVRSTARGEETLLGIAPLSEGPEDILKPAFRGVAVTGWLWIPAALYLERRYGFISGDATIRQVARDPWVWLLPLLGLPSVPIATIAAATDVGMVDLFNPLYLGGAIRRIGRDYWYTVRLVGTACLVGGLAIVAMARISEESLTSLALRQVGVMYVCFASARLLGGLLSLYGYAIGWGDERDYRVPLLATQETATGISRP